MYLRPFAGLIMFHTSTPCPIAAAARWRDAAGPHPSQGHGSSPAAFHQMPRYTADECASIVPGHVSSPFRRSFDAELLAVPAPERGLAAAASLLLLHFGHGLLTLVHRLASTAFSFSLSALCRTAAYSLLALSRARRL